MSSFVDSLQGAVAASALGYIIPGLVYLQTYRRELNKAQLAFDISSEYYEPTPLKRFNKLKRFLFPIFLLLFGIMSLFIGVGSVIYESVHPAGP